jgi:hypothetical protein
VLTLLLYALLAIIVVAGLFALAVFVLPKGEQLAPPAPDTRPWDALPDRQLVADDVVAARLPVALRGYRFAETDLLLDRLTDELRMRDDEIARLRGARPSTTGLPSYGPVSQYETGESEPPAEASLPSEVPEPSPWSAEELSSTAELPPVEVPRPTDELPPAAEPRPTVEPPPAEALPSTQELPPVEAPHPAEAPSTSDEVRSARPHD